MVISSIFAALLFLGVPIALVLGISAIAYIYLSGNTVLYLSFPQQLFAGLENYGLLAIPLFMIVWRLLRSKSFDIFVLSFDLR